MKKKNTILHTLLCLCAVVLLASGLAACQPEDDSSPDEGNVPAGVEQEAPDDQPGESSSESQEPEQEAESTGPQNSATLDVSEPDPAALEAAWKASGHASTFVVDAAGQNNSCAQCHAPIDWLPSMDTLPESCFACKFELEDPPPYIPEDAWAHIPCKVCHRLDDDDLVQPEIAWLDIAPLDEYIDVSSPTELCLKCHAPTEVPQHGKVELVSAHADYECTGCHDAHTASATCVSEACHSDVIQPVTPIPGHDAEHQVVACVACHDASGMQVGPDEETGVWTTFAITPADAEPFIFPSHNIVLESSCDRCHFVNNPWGLSVEVTEP
jgi:hypothetical protein